MDHDTPENIAQTVAKIMEQGGEVDILSNEMTDRDLASPLLIAVPEGQRLADFTKELRAAQSYMKPHRREGTAKLTTLESVITWANRFKGEGSVLYAKNDDDAPSLTCIADYHLSGASIVDVNTGDPTARHGKHRAIYSFPLSKKWQAWMKMSGTAQSGVEMGAFLEDNILDVIDPPIQVTSPGIAGSEASEAELRLIDIARRLEGGYGTGAQLLGMAKSFTVNEAADYAVTNNSTTGEASIQIKSEHLDSNGAPIRVPKLFLIAIPVFEGGAIFRLPVRFQYRKAGPTVKFFLTIHEPTHAKDVAFNEAIKDAADQTELPLLIGSPEA